MTKTEVEDFHLSTLKLSYKEAIDKYTKYSHSRLGKLIANRELPILVRTKELISDF